MLPEIIRDAPRSFLICGMALEPMVPSDEPSHEAGRLHPPDAEFRCGGGAAHTADDGTAGGAAGTRLVGHQTACYLESSLATPVILWAAHPVFRRGWDSIANSSPNRWTLISLGVAAACLYSIVATVLPGTLTPGKPI